MSWIPADQPPQIEPGTLKGVAVARKSKKGKWYVFGAVYLNRYELSEYDDDDEESGVWTGFHVDHKHDYYDQYFESIDVLFWQPLPDPPEA